MAIFIFFTKWWPSAILNSLDRLFGPQTSINLVHVQVFIIVQNSIAIDALL